MLEYLFSVTTPTDGITYVGIGIDVKEHRKYSPKITFSGLEKCMTYQTSQILNSIQPEENFERTVERLWTRDNKKATEEVSFESSPSAIIRIIKKFVK